MRVSRFMLTGAIAALLSICAAAPAGAAAPAARESSAAAVAPAASRVSITPGLRGFDTLGVETPAQIACLSAGGYSFDLIDVIGDAWENEYDAAAHAGMEIALFQGFDPTTWPTPANGTDRGRIVGQKASGKGYPKGAHIFLNVEQNTNASAGTAITWVANWAKAVKAAGYTPGVYIGVPQVLSAAQLNTSLPDVAVFWRSASASAPQAARGFVVRQTAVSRPACGIRGGIDTDVAGVDGRNGTLIGAGFSAARVAPTAAGALVPMAPSRLLDTRSGRPVAPNGVVKVQITPRSGIPAHVAAAVLNVTVTAPTAAGHITAFPSGRAVPNVSNLNFISRQTVPNLVTVPVGADGTVSLLNASTGTSHLLADLQGYYLAGTPTGGGTFASVTPTRLLDTRPNHMVRANASVRVPIVGRVGVPAGATAAVLNVTVAAPTAAGHITAFPTGAPLPDVSNLNFVTGQTVPNLVTVPVGADGSITLTNSSTGSSQLLVDLQGYYLGGTATGAGTFVSVTPTRLLDTRRAGPVAALSAVALKVSGNGPVPIAGVGAVVLNVTVTAPAAIGFASVFPSGRSLPAASNLNFTRGQTVPNLSVVPLGRDGRALLYNGSPGSAQLIADVAGYFRSGL